MYNSTVCQLKLRADSNQAMLAIIWYRIFCLTVCYPKIYRTVILPVVLYGCETWLLTLREDSRLRVFVIRVLRKIFGPKRDKVMGMEKTT